MNNHTIKNTQSQEIFKILQNFQERKREQIKLTSALISAFKKCNHYSISKEDRISSCGNYIAFNKEGRITGANFCRNRMCPICQWRLSLKTYGNIAKIQSNVECDKSLDFLFLTLTIDNTDNLNKGITWLLKAFKLFQDNRKFKRICKGYIRTLEVTYSEKHENWHPHIHMVFAVDKSYFKSKDYMSTSEWALLWKSVAKLDYTPIVDIRKVSENREKAVAEIAKYMVKPFDINRAPQKLEEIYTELLESTYNRRLRSFGGVYRKAAIALNLLNEPELTDEEYDVLNNYHFGFINNAYRQMLLGSQGWQWFNNKTGELYEMR